MHAVHLEANLLGELLGKYIVDLIVPSKTTVNPFIPVISSFTDTSSHNAVRLDCQACFTVNLFHVFSR